MSEESSSPKSSLLGPSGFADLEDTIKVIKLRRAGFSLAEVTETTGIPIKTVRSLLEQAAKELGLLKVEEAEALRGIENERLDAMLHAIWERAANGSLPHIATVLKIMERRAKLLALDLRPDTGDKIDNAMIIPEWAAKKRFDPAVIEYQEKEIEDGRSSDGHTLPEVQEGSAPTRS